jgi:hypothetical protein
MKRKALRIVSVLFLVAVTTVLLSPSVGHSFWYNEIEKITEFLDDDTKWLLHEHLINVVVPELDENLELPDNRGGDSGVTIHKNGKAWDGYTLLSSIGGHLCGKNPLPPNLQTNTCGALLIDMEGNIVHEWPLIAVPAKMLPGGHVLGMTLNFSVGPPKNGMQTLMQMDWDGNEVWSWSGPPGVLGGARVHHDFQREGNPVGYYAPGQIPLLDSGKTLVLSVSDDIDYPNGISSFPLQEDAIYEVNWDGSISWGPWLPYEHVDDMGFDAAAIDAIFYVRVAGIGGPPPGESGPTDWQHLNAASYVGPNKWYNRGDLRFHPDNIIFDSRTANYIGIIARHDNPGEWDEGDIIWRVGPHFTAGYEEKKLGQIIGPHKAHMIPKDLPGWGNILVFDNGGLAGYGSLLPGMPGTYPATIRDYSRVIEFNPITLEKVWEYKNTEDRIGNNGELERKFYSRLISSAQRLPGGNTLITEGALGRVFEVTKQGEIVWEYIHKDEYGTGQFPILGFLPPTAVYRAYRVPAQWVEPYLDGP